ncbi:MAG: HlyD family efflux transporter periplasmic adaptor subunit, partial [Actinomycetota bacterium]
ARARAELGRRSHLAGKGLVAPAGLQAAEAEARAAEAGSDAVRAELARLASERRAAGDGTYVAGGVNNVPYSRQRLDEVRLKLAERRRDLAATDARVVELAAQSAAAQAELARLTDAEVDAPTAGVVWQRFVGAGDGVRAGDPLLGLVDCRGLTLTAVLPKRFFPEIKAGDRAQARLLGEPGEIPAVVQSVRAAGAGQASASAAVVPAAVERRDVVVTLVPLGRALAGRSDNLCRVGQRASVTFDMPALKPLFDAVADGAADMARGLVGAAAAAEEDPPG